MLTLYVTAPVVGSCVPVTIAVSASANFAGTSTAFPSFGSLFSSVTVPLLVVFCAGKSLLVRITFPLLITFSPTTPGNVTFVPFG